MPKTLSQTLEAIRSAVEAKTVDSHEHGGDYFVPDPAYAKLLAVVHDMEAEYKGDYPEATWWWDGAVEGAFIKALQVIWRAEPSLHKALLISNVVRQLVKMVLEEGDTRLAAAQVVLEWLEGEASDV